MKGMFVTTVHSHFTRLDASCRSLYFIRKRETERKEERGEEEEERGEARWDGSAFVGESRVYKYS